MDSSTPRLVDTARLCELCVRLVNDVISGKQLGGDRWKLVREPNGDWIVAVNYHYDKIGLLKRSASQGCQLCCFLCDCLSELDSTLLGRMKTYYYHHARDHYYLHTGDLQNTLEVCRGYPYESIGRIFKTPFYFFDRYTASEMMDPMDLKYGALAWETPYSNWYSQESRKMTVARGTFSDPASLTTLALLNRWLDDCKSRHMECERAILKSPLPKRVIDVGTEDSDPFLYTSLGETADYITLSYSWGGDVVSKTTKSNVSERHKTIILTSLPQTFQDAIIIARGLKIRYIWIDALCIIQDDAEDWLRESVTMSQVYENCILTISATKSNQCESGFLQIRSRVERELGTYLDGAERSLHVKIAQSNVHQIKGPLNNRGWTFQERFLSPAVIHFTEDGIYWECRSLCVNDSGAKLIYNTELKALSTEKELYGEKEYESASGFKELWTRIVENYCQRSLTFPEDKLVALSGIAQRYQVKMNSRYVAGLWEDGLMRWLLWEKSTTRPWYLEGFGQRSSIYRAPSWSWASLDGSFTWQRELFETDPIPCPNLPFQIQGYAIEEMTPGACGKISDAHLTITALLYKAVYTIKYGWIHGEKLRTEIGTWNCSIDVFMFSKSVAEDIKSTLADESEEEWAGPCWVMPIAIWSDNLWGLVLGRPPGVFKNSPGSLMRLGMAKLDLPEDGGPLPDHSIGKEEYNTEEPDIDHFPSREKRQSERSIAAEADSCFFDGMSENERDYWERRMSKLQFDKSRVRTIRII